MHTGGWVLLIVSWMVILGLLIFCLRRVLSKGLGGSKQRRKS